MILLLLLLTFTENKGAIKVKLRISNQTELNAIYSSKYESHLKVLLKISQSTGVDATISSLFFYSYLNHLDNQKIDITSTLNSNQIILGHNTSNTSKEVKTTRQIINLHQTLSQLEDEVEPLNNRVYHDGSEWNILNVDTNTCSHAKTKLINFLNPYYKKRSTEVNIKTLTEVLWILCKTLYDVKNTEKAPKKLSSVIEEIKDFLNDLTNGEYDPKKEYTDIISINKDFESLNVDIKSLYNIANNALHALHNIV